MQVSEVRIERYADQGRCVAHIDGRAVFVASPCPTNSCRVELDEAPTGTTGSGPASRRGSRAVRRPSHPGMAAPVPPAMAGSGRRGSRARLLPGQLKWKAITVSEQMSQNSAISTWPFPSSACPATRQPAASIGVPASKMIADDNGMPIHAPARHNRVAIDTMPLATRTLLDVAKREHVWEGGFGTRLPDSSFSVPEPRGGVVKMQRQQTTITPCTCGRRRCAPAPSCSPEQVTINGTTFDYQVDANGFWQVHRQAPIALRYARDQPGQRAVAVSGGRRNLDLYSGSGLFTLPLATMTGERTACSA